MANYTNLAEQGGIYLEKTQTEGWHSQPGRPVRQVSIGEARKLLGQGFRVVYQRPHVVSVRTNIGDATAFLVNNTEGRPISFNGGDLTALVGQHVLIRPDNKPDIVVRVFPRPARLKQEH